MPTSDKEPTHTDLTNIIEGLLESGIDFILVGGLAAVVQGAPVTTMDVDVVHDQSPGNIERLYEFLTSIDASYRQPGDRSIRPTREHLSGKGHLLLATRLGPLDVLAVIEQGKSYKDLVDNTVEIRFKGRLLRVLNLDTLIRLKEDSQYSKDKQRLAVLRETLRQLEEANRPAIEDEKDVSEIGAEDDEPTNHDPRR
jgi:hypothetical protein